MPRRQKDAVRSPDDIVQINLRIREKERLKLEAVAKSKGVSMNGEILSRIWNPEMAEAWRIIEQVNVNLTPLLQNAIELKKENDVAVLIEALIDCVQPLLAIGVIDGPTAHEIRAIIEQYSVVKRARRLHAGGAKP